MVEKWSELILLRRILLLFYKSFWNPITIIVLFFCITKTTKVVDE